jgi:hypothetical protein
MIFDTSRRLALAVILEKANLVRKGPPPRASAPSSASVTLRSPASNDLGLVVTPLEEIGCGHRHISEEDSGSGRSTIIDTRHPFFATRLMILESDDSLAKDRRGLMEKRKFAAS